MNTPARLAALIVLAAFAFTGCVSTKYKMAPKASPAAVALNLAAASEPNNASPAGLEALVNTVIVFRGPGSWKRAAYWDEYVLTLVNRSDAAVTIESADLTDFQNQSVAPGAIPWEIEKQSRTYVARVRSTTGNILKIGAGGLLSVTAAGLSGAALGPLFLGASWFGPALEGAALGTIVAIPVYAVGSVYRNISKKHQVEAEFRRRRLALPATVDAGQTVQGSLFFRISPGPRRLALHTRTGSESRDVRIDLTALSDLHLQSAAATSSPALAPVRNP